MYAGIMLLIYLTFMSKKAVSCEINAHIMRLDLFFFIYIYIYSRLSLSRIPRDSLKHFEISVPQHIRVERVRETIN